MSEPPLAWLDCPNGCGASVSQDTAADHLLGCTTRLISATCPACHRPVAAKEAARHETKSCPKLVLLRKLREHRAMFENLERGKLTAAQAAAAMQDRFDSDLVEKESMLMEARSNWDKRASAPSTYTDDELAAVLDSTDENEVRVYALRAGPEWDLLRAQLSQRARNWI